MVRSYPTANSNEPFMVFPLGFGRLEVLVGVSISGTPHGFPSPGSKLTQGIEGIPSSREDLGSYSTGFLTSLRRLNEELVFEVQVAKKRVSVFFYVIVSSRNLQEAASRALSAVQGIRGAVSGAYGKNVEVRVLDKEGLMSALSTGFGGTLGLNARLVRKGDEGDRGLDPHGVLAKVAVVSHINGNSVDVDQDIRYAGILEFVEGLPALKASDRENQISRLINSLLDLDLSNASFIVHMRPNKVSFLRKRLAKGRAKALMPGSELKDNLRSFQDLLGDEKTVRELNEIRYGEWSGYWKVSVHLVVDSKSAQAAFRSMDVAMASLTSIFSDPTFAVEVMPLRGRNLLRAVRDLPMRRMVAGRSIEMSSVRLSALVHMPTQAYPGIDRRELPEFEVPKSSDELEAGKMVLGNVLHGDREIYPAGIDVNDLTLSMVVVGHIGSGKTMFVSQLLLSLWEVDPTVGWIVFDAKGEYAPVAKLLPEPVKLYRPGDESLPLRLNIFDPGVDSPESHALKLFAILRDTLSSLFEDSADLSPQMERLCREALMRTTADAKKRSFKGFYLSLEEQARVMQPNTPTIMSSMEAIKNRVEKFRHGVLRNVFDVDSTNMSFDAITDVKVVIDVSYLLSHGGTKDDVRLLMNVILKNMFDRVMKLGLSRGLRHIVVVEEATLLVPEVFSRKTSGETTPAEDIVLVERALGEGMIFVSPRPTISENILANSGTKVIFRCPYDSKRVAKFLNLNISQERYLKVLPKREAIVAVPNYPYPFRIKTLDSELSTLPQRQPQDKLPQVMPWNRQREGSTSENDNNGFVEGENVCMADTAITDDEKGDNNPNTAPAEHHGTYVEEKDALNRLLKKGVDSDRFKVFRAVALRHPEPAKASTIVEEELGGEWRRVIDAYRILQDTKVWREALIKTVGTDSDDGNEGLAYELTEYGQKVWKAIMTETNGKREASEV